MMLNLIYKPIGVVTLLKLIQKFRGTKGFINVPSKHKLDEKNTKVIWMIFINVLITVIRPDNTLKPIITISQPIKNGTMYQLQIVQLVRHYHFLKSSFWTSVILRLKLISLIQLRGKPSAQCNQPQFTNHIPSHNFSFSTITECEMHKTFIMLSSVPKS